MSRRQVLALLAFDLPHYRRLAEEGSWTFVSQIAAVLGSLVVVRVLTGNLDTPQYGQLALGLTSAGFVNQLPMDGLSLGTGCFSVSERRSPFST